MGLKYRVYFTSPRDFHVVLLLLLLAVNLTTYVLGTDTEWKLPDSHNNTIPDFSHVGYRAGHVPIPMFPVKKTLKPIEGSRDDTARIQAAIDEVGNMPLTASSRDRKSVV